MSKRTRVASGAGLSLGVVFAVPATAQATDFTVTNLNATGPGSLEQASEQALDSSSASDRILFKSKLSGTISLTDEAIYLGGGGDVQVIGPGARQLTVDAAPGVPVFGPFATFDGAPPADVSISGLRITGGNNDNAFFGYYGGGVQGFGEVDVTLSRVTISGNHADASGGGVAMIAGPGGAVGSLVVESSTISGNTADVVGGGIYVYYDAPLSIRNSTISGNATDTTGGGAFVGGDTEIRNSTVTRNDAGFYGGGLYESGSNEKVLRGTIVAANTADDAYPDLDDGPWAASFSLIENTTDDGGLDPIEIVNGGGNILDVDPNLKPLKNNGGPTDTHAFKKSPAKNKGPSDASNADQRGAPRKGKPDIGAYEFTRCKGVIVNRVGTAGKDKLKGTKKKDGILGLGGNDKLSGKKGKDGLCGGSGKDKLKGGPGVDKLNGGPGKDKEIQ